MRHMPASPHRLAKFGVGEYDVRVREAVVVLSREILGMVNCNHEHAESLGVLLDAVAHEHLSDIHRHALRGAVDRSSSSNRTLDETTDERKVEHVRGCFRKGNSRGLDGRHAHEREGDIPDEGGLGQMVSSAFQPMLGSRAE